MGSNEWSGTMLRSIGLRLLLVAALLAMGLVGTVQPAAAVVPGENGKIAFASNRAGAHEIYTMNADGTGQTRITYDGGGNFDPAWSPDGSKIAFESGGQIHMVNADGTGRRRLTSNPGSSLDPSWAPDGSKIAFTSGILDARHIYVMNADGTGQMDLMPNGGDAHFPDWSPDGSKIAYSNGAYEIRVMNADGTGRIYLTGKDARHPAWSPDGSKIVFDRGQLGGYGIYVMNADGTGETRLTGGAWRDQWPAWSPDGSKIAFATDRNGEWEIYVMNADGSGETRLGKAAGGDLYPDWQAVPVGNQPPTVDAGDDVWGSEGSAISLGGSASDTDSDTLSYSWSYTAGAGLHAAATCSFGDPSAASTTINCTDNGTYTAALTVEDGTNPAVSDSLSVTVGNVAPEADFGSPDSASEGSSFDLTLNNASDRSTVDAAQGFTYAFDCGSGYGAFGSASVASCPAGTRGALAVGGKIKDKDGGVTEYTDSLTVVASNTAPVITSLAAPTGPQAVSTAISVSAGFTDANAGDTHTGTIEWGDGTSSAGPVTESGGSGTVGGSHTYTAAGVYTLKLTVTDNDGAADSETYQYVVVYDSAAGFVTGGGWIESPAGAYAAAPTLAGKASFGFVSRYQKGATAPSGNTQFQFHAGGLNFRSTSYEWLVISGPKAQYKGSGTINGTGEYGFLLTANDGQVSGGGGVDRFRIKIWDRATGSIVYDNQMGDAEDGAASDAIEGGSIVIHK